MGILRTLIRLLLIPLPWVLKRPLLQWAFGYELDRTARIGLAWAYPRRLRMGPHSYIGHFTVILHLDECRLDERARLGRMNWVTGFPAGHPRHFAHQPDRRPRLHIERHAAVTHRHIIDCTSEVIVGEFATMAGFRSQILTHSIDLAASRQSSEPVRIGARTFVGTGCVLLGGAVLPAYSVLGASSLLNKAYDATHTLYGGVPARPIKTLPADWPYFTREHGFVD